MSILFNNFQKFMESSTRNLYRVYIGNSWQLLYHPKREFKLKPIKDNEEKE